MIVSRERVEYKLSELNGTVTVLPLVYYLLI